MEKADQDREEQPRHDWRRTAEEHLPYRTLERNELEKIYNREDFQRAIIESAVRQHQDKPGSHTPNSLEKIIENDILRSTDNILLPQEIRELASTSRHIILDSWKRHKQPA